MTTFQLNLESKGAPIVAIKETGEKKAPIIYLEREGESARFPFSQLHLEGDQYFQVIPNPLTERQVIYITGQSGSGKSYWIAQYGAEYHKMYPKRSIYLFSSLSDDKSIDSIKGLKRVKIGPDLMNEELTAEDFKDSLVLFDDTDCITDKAMRTKVNRIMGSVLETGRHFNTSCIVSSHLACSGADTKRILNEAQKIIFFPASIGAAKLKYLLESYSSLDKEQQKKLKKIKSRWICIEKSYPPVVISQHDIFLPNAV
jgi:hypothetical protein